MNSTLKRLMSLLAVGATLAMLNASPAYAVLKHKYTFNNGTANDSVGGMNATVVDSGAVTALYTTSGQLDLSANAGQGSNTAVATRNDAYVDLPNGIIKGAVNSGTVGAVSFEWWFTITTQRTWARLGDFGVSAGGEDMSNDGATTDYIMVTANSGRTTATGQPNNGLEMTSSAALDTTTNIEPNLINIGPFPLLVQRHVVAVYDHTNTTAGPNGTMSLYLNGVASGVPGPGLGTGEIDTNLDLRTFNDVNNWLGRAQYNDPFFDGLFNEFRIYDHALNATEVAASFSTGPDPVPLPTVIVNKNTGAMFLKNLSTSPFALNYYEIRSALGGLNPANGAWNSLSDQGIDSTLPTDFNNVGGVNGADLDVWKGAFGTSAAGDANLDGDSDGNDFLAWQQQIGKTPGEGDSWDEAGGSTDNVLAEAFLTSGSVLAPGQLISLGTAFRTSIFGAGNNGDLTFNFGQVGTAILTPSSVQYVTTNPTISAVPEPATLGASLLALAALAAVRRRNAA